MIDLNKDWHIYKIVEPVILTAVVFLVLAIQPSIRNFPDNRYHHIEWYAVKIWKARGKL